MKEDEANTLKGHWESVYEQRTPEAVSWFQPRPERSLRLIQDSGVPPRNR
ncbi:MAG: hypothetical protein U5L11_04550 [Arhodomonas sp.]|nr:hypothetical protein [Arhodomonas sp.]